jgi:hypothetical protein
MLDDRKAPPEISKDELTFPADTPSVDRPNTFRGVLIALIFVLVAILIDLLSWFFLLQDNRSALPPLVTDQRPTAEENNEPESATAEVITETQQVMSPSTEIDSIENDINSTQDIDLNPLFADIEAMFE